MKNIKQKGFTLIELLIVMVILGILAVAVAPKFVNFSADAKEATAEGVEGALKAAALIGIADIAMGNNDPTNNAVGAYPKPTEAGIGAYFEKDGLNVDVATAGQYKVTVQDDGAASGTAACIVTYAATSSGYTVTSDAACSN